MENISEILCRFGIPVNDFHIEPVASGHINSTFKVYSGGFTYILQRVNTDIFKNPEQVMHNIEKALKCINDRPAENNRFVEYLEADGRNFCVCNGFWRACRYIESAEISPDSDSIYAFGKALGEFHKLTENVPISELYVTIQDFHNIEKNIMKVLSLDNIGREQSRAYNEFLEYYSGRKKYFSDIRLVHNDAKWANILVNPETLLPDVLIDLDTVMPGYAAFDFGDAVRSSCVTEDCRIDPVLLEAFSRGYSGQYRNICPEEAAAGISAVAAELSARYLYDVLTQSRYFALSEPEKLEKHAHNLRLAEFAMNNSDMIKDILSR